MAALGVLDWGIGGLGFVRALQKRAPHADIVYLSDSGAVPYGKLAAAALSARVTRAVDALITRGASEVVIACNAASSVASRVTARVPLTPIIAAGVACVPTELRGTLWVLGGRRIVRSGIYTRALTRPRLRVRGRVAQPLSAHIEAGSMNTHVFERALQHVLAPVRDGDAILLACTHYPAALDDFRRFLPTSAIFDPAETLASSLAERVSPRSSPAPRARFFTTGSASAMRAAAKIAWDMALDAVTEIALTD